MPIPRVKFRFSKVKLRILSLPSLSNCKLLFPKFKLPLPGVKNGKVKLKITFHDLNSGLRYFDLSFPKLSLNSSR
jgi:hypothetical protein